MAHSNVEAFKNKLKTLIKADMSDTLKEEMATAASFCVNHGYTDFPALIGLAQDLGLRCEWCGGLHYNEEHVLRMETYNQRCASCGCHKDALKPVKTGFVFTDDVGLEHHGDLFWCKEHGVYAIFGVSNGWASETTLKNSRYYGVLSVTP